MTKWEYSKESFQGQGMTEIELDRAGENGWELIGCMEHIGNLFTYYFKRPLPDAENQTP